MSYCRCRFIFAVDLQAACFSPTIAGMRRIYSAILGAAVLLLSSAAPAAAAEDRIELAQAGPRACVGYHPEVNAWGLHWLQEVRKQHSGLAVIPALCPPGYAFFGIQDAAADTAPEVLLGNCCPLPDKTMLTEEHRWVNELCPADSVVTGLKIRVQPRYMREQVRCTTIDRRRFALREPAPAAYWGIGRNMLSIYSAGKLKKSDIPVAVRYAFGRMTRFEWDQDGCVGQPVGSLFVGGRGGTCSKMYFSEVVSRSGMRASVKMFPDCRMLSGPFEPEPRCLNQ